MKRLVRLSDKDSILEALNNFQAVFPNLTNKVESIEGYAKKLSQYAQVYYAYRDDDLFGLLILYANDIKSKIAYISLIGIKREFEHMGLGTYLLDSAADIANENGMEYIKLEVDNYNTHAFAFYKRNGFDVCGAVNESGKYMIRKTRKYINND